MLSTKPESLLLTRVFCQGFVLIGEDMAIGISLVLRSASQNSSYDSISMWRKGSGYTGGTSTLAQAL
jgi:hypothetical protein